MQDRSRLARATLTTKPNRHGAIAAGTHFLRSMLAIGRLSTPQAVATYRRTVDARAGMGFFAMAEVDELRKRLEERAAILGRVPATPVVEELATVSVGGVDSLPTETPPGAPAPRAGGEA